MKERKNNVNIKISLRAKIRQYCILFFAVIFVLSTALFIFSGCSKKQNTTELKTIEQIYANSISSIVEVNASGTSNGNAGTGFTLKKDGNTIYIATNKHIFLDEETGEANIYNFESVNIVLYNNNGVRNESIDNCKVIGFDSYNDIAVIKAQATNAANITPLTLAGGKQKVGESVVAIGNAGGRGLSVYEGIVSKLDAVVKSKNKYAPVTQITAPINAGSSGCPVFNLYGEVVGIGTYQLLDSEIDNRPADRISFCVPSAFVANSFFQIVNEHLISGSTEKEMSSVNAQLAEHAPNLNYEYKYDFGGLLFGAHLNNGTLDVLWAAQHLPVAGSSTLNVNDRIYKIGELEIANASLHDVLIEVSKYVNEDLNPALVSKKELIIYYLKANGAKDQVHFLSYYKKL